MARKVSEALAKMEQRCDLWLSRKIAEDQWHTFEDCLVAVRGSWGNAEEDWITMYKYVSTFLLKLQHGAVSALQGRNARLRQPRAECMKLCDRRASPTSATA
jgi:hypothetical protein